MMGKMYTVLKMLLIKMMVREHLMIRPIRKMV